MNIVIAILILLALCAPKRTCEAAVSGAALVDMNPYHAQSQAQPALVVVPPPHATAQRVAMSVSVSWNPVPGADHYNLYYGTGERDYTELVACAATNRVITGLNGWQEYHFGLTAVDVFGIESDFSPDVPFTPTLVLDLKFPNSTAGAVLQSSSNQLNWAACAANWTNGAWRVTADPARPWAFYREVYKP